MPQPQADWFSSISFIVLTIVIVLLTLVKSQLVRDSLQSR
jgi:hypothetical protein